MLLADQLTADAEHAERERKRYAERFESGDGDFEDARMEGWWEGRRDALRGVAHQLRTGPVSLAEDRWEPPC